MAQPMVRLKPLGCGLSNECGAGSSPPAAGILRELHALRLRVDPRPGVRRGRPTDRNPPMELRNPDEVRHAAAALASGSVDALDRLTWTGVFGAPQPRVAARAAALREGWRGPVFLQGDHFQINAKKYAGDPEGEMKALRELTAEAIQAGFYNIDVDTSTLVDLSKAGHDAQQAANGGRCAELTA